MKLLALLGNYDRPTNRSADRQTDRSGHRTVSFPIGKIGIYKLVQNMQKRLQELSGCEKVSTYFRPKLIEPSARQVFRAPDAV